MSATRALANARHVIGLEQALRVFHEQSIQAVALTLPLGIRFANIVYESSSPSSRWCGCSTGRPTVTAGRAPCSR